MNARVIVFAAAFLVAAYGSNAAAATPPAPIVHAGDQLDVEVLGEPSVSGHVSVAQDGTIGLPLAGEVKVSGATVVDAGKAITVALSRYIRQPHVAVSIIEQGTITVLVLGDVVNSGEYPLTAGARLSDAIAAAGGLSPSISGAYPVARIALPDGTVDHISLEKLLRGADPSRDVQLANRAAIYVPGPTQFDVTMLGAVNEPGQITVNEGDRVSLAIAKAGNNVSSKADLSHIMLTRVEDDGSTGSHPVDLYQALEHGDKRYDPRLRKGDVVYIPSASARSNENLINVLFVIGHLFLL